MTQPFFSIKPAEPSDSEHLWLWRSDPLARAMSGNTEEIPWEIHDAWFHASLLNENRKTYIGWIDQRRIGVCRFDINTESQTAEVSINLNPLERGKGLSHLLLSASIKQFRALFACSIIARVKADNLASIKCFQKSGFSYTHENLGFNFYELT